ncbi:MAG: hypothetical protein K0S09_1580 [Sphingobacteriaceae bacterium]|jgi:hypothetical protein|nr:hypothetical protein [Sphingobacteriaceae bacterium]
MKQGISKWVGAVLFAVAMPMFASADSGPGKERSDVAVLVSTDHVQESGIQDDKDKKKTKDKDAKAAAEDAKKDAGTKTAATAKPDIKEVPKARPKLRPAAVADKIKVKKVPVKVKPKLIRSIGL